MSGKIEFPPKWILWLSSIASGSIYLAFTLPFPLIRYYASDPPLDYAKLTGHSTLGFLAYLAGVGALFGLHLLSLRALASGRMDTNGHTVRFVLLSGAAFGLILLFSYPQTAIDLFIYAIRTRGWALYGLSPFSTTPQAFPTSDPWLGLAGEWAGAASPYGPAWEWLSLGLYHLSGGNYLGHLFAIKTVSLLATLGSSGLVYQILRRIRPQWALVGMAFFIWNPLVLLESVQNAHNDIVMMFFMLLAIWAYVHLSQGLAGRQQLFFSGIFIGGLALSILVKFVTLLVLPFFLLGFASQQQTWGRRTGVLAFYGLAITLIVLLAMAPGWPGLDNWAVLQAGRQAGRSLLALLVLTLAPRMGVAAAFDVASVILYAILGGIYLWGLRRVLRSQRKSQQEISTFPETPIRIAFYIFFWYVLCVVPVFHAWYLLWCLPLAALLVLEERAASGAWSFSLAALLIIPYYETVRVWIPYLNQNHWLGQLIGVSLMALPVLLSLWKPLRWLPGESPSNLPVKPR